MTVQAFDAVAGSYDDNFTNSPLGRELRQIVWKSLESAFTAGSRVLELNCGTGEDAVWLARRGVRVIATDVAPAMLELASQKAVRQGLSDRIEFRTFDLAHPSGNWPDSTLDGALSDFGGLNCIADPAPLARMLARTIKPGGNVILVIMGRSCAWEFLWYMARLHPQAALRRRRRRGCSACIGGVRADVWYPSIRRLRGVFGPQFRIRRLEGLGVFLPPSFLQNVVTSRPALFRLLLRAERSLGDKCFLRRFGDHLIIHLERTSFPPQD